MAKDQVPVKNKDGFEDVNGDGKEKKTPKKNPKKKGGYKKDYRVPTRTNPVEWYYPNEQLGKDSASIPYHIMTGLGHDIYPDTSNITDQRVVPGIMRIELVDGVGYSSSSTSTINTAVRSIYSWVRHQNSGHSNYEAPDLGIYILAMSEIYAAFAEACRMYRVAMTYKWVNRYIPDALLTAMGGDAKDIRENLAQFRAGLNLFAAKVSSLAVPNVFPVFKRHDMLYSNIYMDSDTDRGQYYVFVKANYRLYDPKTASTGGYLKSANRISGTETVFAILTRLNNMLERVLSDEDMNIMSGDILKAYGRENLFVINSVDENATCQPVFDETILGQIENISCLPKQVFYSFKDNTKTYTNRNILSLDITQRDGYLLYEPRINYQHSSEPAMAGEDNTYLMENVIPKHFIMNSHKNDPDWKESLENSRFMVSYENVGNVGIKINSGSEFVSDISIYTNVWLKSKNAYSLKKYDLSLLNRCYTFRETALKEVVLSEALILLAAFDWHPFVYNVIASDGTGESDTTGCCPMGDFKTFAYLDTSDISNLHQCAILGLFRTNLLT